MERVQRSRKAEIIRTIKEYSPKIGMPFGTEKNFANFRKYLKESSANPRVLIIGGATEGRGIRQLLDDPKIEVIETDVSFGPRTQFVCDAHDIPFEDQTFDGVVSQAVLEHVANPWRCAQEIYRVTQEHGVVFAITPFIQQVHEGRYDFTRFTHLGHRRLFRQYEELDSGPICGPGMALAWSYFHFLKSFFRSRLAHALVRRFAGFTAFWLKYLDGYLINQPGAYDAASGYYFIGRKTPGYLLTDRELIAGYKGVQG